MPYSYYTLSLLLSSSFLFVPSITEEMKLQREISFKGMLLNTPYQLTQWISVTFPPTLCLIIYYMASYSDRATDQHYLMEEFSDIPDKS